MPDEERTGDQARFGGEVWSPLGDLTEKSHWIAGYRPCNP